MSTVTAVLVLAVPALLSWPLGRAMAAVMHPRDPVGRFRAFLERLLSSAGGGALAREQDWKRYAVSLLAFNGCAFAIAVALLAAQPLLPFNPDARGALQPSLIFHTAASFVTNTDQQHYAGEAVLSYGSQLAALMWLMFVSAATGLAALAALARALSGEAPPADPASPVSVARGVPVGNFYRDLLRASLFILLPLSCVLACVLAAAGVPMTLHGAVAARTLEGAVQTIARGPVAALVAIKQLGTNGGGFFGPNAAHPFENPSFLTNIIECCAILLLPMASVWMFGRITCRLRHAAVVFGVMALLLAAMTVCAMRFERAPTAALARLPVAAGPNLEGKELRFGAGAAPLWGAATTAAGNGSVNAMHDSFNPLTGLVPLAGMWLNVAFGGVGVGMVNMFVYIIVGVFLCGMMVGRTPEYMNRKVETAEMKLALLALLIHPFLILGGTALFASTPWGAAAVRNPGAHGFTEILYEFSSAAANNGSGFEGLADGTAAWNLASGIVMLLARFVPIILPLVIAGSMAAKRPTPETSGTLRSDTPLFGIVIAGSVVLIGALLFLPAAVLGPIVDHLSVAP